MNTDQRHRIASDRENDAARVLARLRQGPATTTELYAVCRSFRQRLGDLRKAYVITCVRRGSDLAGDSIFTLKGPLMLGQLPLLGAA